LNDEEEERGPRGAGRRLGGFKLIFWVDVMDNRKRSRIFWCM